MGTVLQNSFVYFTPCTHLRKTAVKHKFLCIIDSLRDMQDGLGITIITWIYYERTLPISIS